MLVSFTNPVTLWTCWSRALFPTCRNPREGLFLCQRFGSFSVYSASEGPAPDMLRPGVSKNMGRLAECGGCDGQIIDECYGFRHFKPTYGEPELVLLTAAPCSNGALRTPRSSLEASSKNRCTGFAREVGCEFRWHIKSPFYSVGIR